MTRLFYRCLFIGCVLFMVHIHYVCQAQEHPSVPVNISGKKALILGDSVIIIKTDTTIYLPEGTSYSIKDLSEYRTDKFYNTLEKKSNKSEISSRLYDFLIEEHSDSGKHEESFAFTDIDKQFEAFEGRTIGKISVRHVPLYAGDVHDTLQNNKNSVSRLMNSTHVKTLTSIIRRGLQFDEGEPLEAVRLAESERLLRGQSYIQDVHIYIKERAGNTVEVIVVVQDRYTLGVDFNYSGLDDWAAYLVESNFMGTATALSGGLLYDSYYTDAWGQEVQIENPNLNGKFLQGEARVLKSAERSLLKLRVNKDFLSPESRFAGGFEYRYQRDLRNQLVQDSIYKLPYRGFFLDGWCGRSFLIGDLKERKNLILSARLIKRYFNEKPAIGVEQGYAFFNNTDILLGSIIYKKIDYYSTKNLLSFDITENLPYGYYVSLTAGYEESELYNWPYVGGDVAYAKNIGKLGYISASFRWGTFYNRLGLSDANFRLNLDYYTNVIDIGNVKWRHLFWLQYSWLVTEQLQGYLTYEDNLRDIAAPTWTGESRAIAKMESVFFLPGNFYGFKFAAYAFADLGWLSETKNAFNNSRFVSDVGLGIRMRNESLVISTISLHIGYISDTPENGTPVEFYFSSSSAQAASTPFHNKPELLLPQY